MRVKIKRTETVEKVYKSDPDTMFNGVLHDIITGHWDEGDLSSFISAEEPKGKTQVKFTIEVLEK